MAASCNLIPQIRTAQGKLVDSILFTDILAQSKNRQEALATYQQIFSAPFKKEFGDWYNFPSKAKGRLDANGEPMLSDAQPILSSSSWDSKLKVAIADIEAITEAENLVTDDNTDVYESKGANGVTQYIYKRVTAFVDVAFGGRSWFNTPEENAAIKAFKEKGLAHTEKITIEGKEYTFDEYVEMKRMDINTYGRIYGKLAHAIVQNKVRPNAKTAAEIRAYAAGEPGVSHPIEPFRYNWIDGSLKEVFRKVGINIFEGGKPEKLDKLIPELTVFSKVLGIAGTVDGLIQHSNGDYSIADWKFGAKFLKNTDNVDKFLKYGTSQIQDMGDTNLNRAKMEVVLRALILKEQYGNDIKFRWMKIVHLSKNKGETISGIDVRPFLGMIESYYSDPANKQEHVVAGLKARGLLDASSYTNSVSELEDPTLNMTLKDQLEQKERELSAIQYRVGHLAKDYLTADERKQINQLTNDITALKVSAGVDSRNITIDEMGIFKRLFGNKYSSKHPMIQTFFRMYEENMAKVRRQKQEFEAKHDELLKLVKAEYSSKRGALGTLDTLTKGGLNFLKYKDLYDFMWVEKHEPGRDGWYANVITEENGRYVSHHKDSNGNKITKEWSKAQYDYNKYVRESMAEQYKKTMTKVVRHENGRALERWEDMGMPAELDADFIPRYMTSMEEVVERHGFLSKDALKYQFNGYIFNFTDSLYETTNIQKGIPIKYMGNDTIIGSENHTFSTELAYKNFMASLVMKDELDNLYSIGSGIVNVLESERDEKGNLRYEVDKNFLVDQIYLNILNISKEPNWSSRGVKIPVGKTATGETTYREISVARLMKTTKTWVSMSSMWLQFVGASANLALIIIVNANNAIVGSMSKRLGIADDDVYFTTSTLYKAHKQYGELMWDIIRGKKEQNKLWLMAKHMNYLPDNYDYAVRKGDMVGVKNKWFDKGNFYIFHAIGEEYGAFVTLAAQMNQYKMNGKPAMDQYTVKDGKLVYTGGKRGTLKDGSDLGELTGDEINLFKRVYARMHGGYRQDERTAMELTAAGQWVTQFRRYLPSALENLYQGSYEDVSIGKYTIIKRENGENVYDWVGRVNEGRMRTLLAFLMHTSKLKHDPDYSWKELSSDQQQGLLNLMMTGVTFGSMLVAKHLLFGDDEDDDPWAKRLDRLADDSTQTLWYPDLLKSMQSQTVALPKLYRASVSVSDLLFNGMILGKETKRGEMVGSAGSIRVLPFGSAIKEGEAFGVWGENQSRQ